MLRLIASAIVVCAALMAWNWPTPAAEPEPAPCLRMCVDCPPFCAGAYVPPGE